MALLSNFLKNTLSILTSTCFQLVIIAPLMCSGSAMEGRIVENITTDYDRTLRPVLDHQTILNLTFNMKIWQIMEIDEKHQKITIQNYFQMRWVNEMLRWNPEDFGNITNVPVRPDQVWTPDVVLLNCADSEGDVIQKKTDVVSLDYTGACYWYPKVMMTASFIAHTKYFPFDSQNISFRFESWSLPATKFRIQTNNDSMVDEHYHHSSLWKLVGQDKEVSLQKYNGDIYSDINFTFMFSRKPSYYVTALILPCLILVSIVMFSYYLPASSGERMGVVVTALLGFAVFLEVVSDSLPQNSNSTSILSMYILGTMFQCALSFFVTCFVITLIHKTHNNNDLKPPPQFLRKLLQLTVKEKTTHKTSGCNGIRHIMTSQVSPYSEDTGVRSLSEGGGVGGDLYLENFRKHSMDSSLAQSQSNALDSTQVPYLPHILDNLQQMTASMRKDQDDSGIQIEWVRLSQFIDRLSFWIFMFLVVLSISLLFIGFHVGQLGQHARLVCGREDR